jgi:hypothetical protein
VLLLVPHDVHIRPSANASPRQDDAPVRRQRNHPLVSSEGDRQEESDRLGWKFWVGLVGVTLACGIGLILGVVLFGLAWRTWGLVGAVIALVGVTMGAKYLTDRRARQRWS